MWSMHSSENADRKPRGIPPPEPLGPVLLTRIRVTVMRIERAVRTFEERQSDCFSHVHATSLRYLIVLPGIVVGAIPEPVAVTVARDRGRVSAITPEYLYMTQFEPAMLPGECGPFTVLLVL